MRPRTLKEVAVSNNEKINMGSPKGMVVAQGRENIGCSKDQEIPIYGRASSGIGAAANKPNGFDLWMGGRKFSQVVSNVGRDGRQR